jgi:calcium/proton exchanger cax
MLAVSSEFVSAVQISVIKALALNATFGNAAEFIIAIVTLRAGQLDIVKPRLPAPSSAMFCLFLVFLAGGLCYKEQTTARAQAQKTCSLQAVL